MNVFAIGDLHLSTTSDKPMDVFGGKWDGHLEKIRNAWNEVVSNDDLVLIPGDISWASRLEDALSDLLAFADLPGEKVLLRGNHDYWWNSPTKLRAVLPERMHAVQNDSFVYGNVCVGGSRGWSCPGSSAFTESDDRKLYERECIRLELSLKSMEAHAADGMVHVGMLHFPPFNEKRRDSGFTELFEKYAMDYVVYGHLHDKACKDAFEGDRNGVHYELCSADHVEFRPKRIFNT